MEWYKAFFPNLANATSMVRTMMRSLQCCHLMVDLTALFIPMLVLSSITMIAELPLGSLFKAFSTISTSGLNSPFPNDSIWHPSVKLEGNFDSAQSLSFNFSISAFFSLNDISEPAVDQMIEFEIEFCRFGCKVDFSGTKTVGSSPILNFQSVFHF